ncbi:MAG: hypothetical protein ACYDEV_17335 [Acidiferrobacter sp.]
MNRDKWLGIGGVLLAAITGASIWLSLAVPQHQLHEVRRETGQALQFARRILANSGGHCGMIVKGNRGLTATSSGTPGSCAAVVTFSHSAFIPAVLRGARLRLTVKHGQDLCSATGGHGAGVGDFPHGCRYTPGGMLL